jgi:hypothetical protein
VGDLYFRGKDGTFLRCFANPVAASAAGLVIFNKNLFSLKLYAYIPKALTDHADY